MVDLLLQHGADKESQDIEGRSAVDLATALGHHTIATLMQAGTISTSHYTTLILQPFSCKQSSVYLGHIMLDPFKLVL